MDTKMTLIGQQVTMIYYCLLIMEVIVRIDLQKEMLPSYRQSLVIDFILLMVQWMAFFLGNQLLKQFLFPPNIQIRHVRLYQNYVVAILHLMLKRNYTNPVDFQYFDRLMLKSVLCLNFESIFIMKRELIKINKAILTYK